jgi:hypothetical protein
MLIKHVHLLLLKFQVCSFREALVQTTDVHSYQWVPTFLADVSEHSLYMFYDITGHSRGGVFHLCCELSLKMFRFFFCLPEPKRMLCAS